MAAASRCWRRRSARSTRFEHRAPSFYRGHCGQAFPDRPYVDATETGRQAARRARPDLRRNAGLPAESGSGLHARGSDSANCRRLADSSGVRAALRTRLASEHHAANRSPGEPDRRRRGGTKDSGIGDGQMTKPRHIHLIGICGTAMASLAGMLQESGFHVTGSDAAAYPPMSTFLESLGIPVAQPFAESNLDPKPDLVVVGNALSRGNVELERILDERIPFCSLPQIL